MTWKEWGIISDKKLETMDKLDEQYKIIITQGKLDEQENAQITSQQANFSQATESKS